LVVPEALWQRLAPAGRLSILRHELAHFQRGDLGKSTIIRLLALPHWFNPLAWLAVRRFDEAAEWACDEVAKGADLEGCRAYAKALLQLDAACGPRPSYHAAVSGRGLLARVQRLLSPQVKEDSLMKKTTILAVALSLALVCLVRLDLVAKEPTATVRAKAPPAAERPLDSQAEKSETPVPSLQAQDSRVRKMFIDLQPAANKPLNEVINDSVYEGDDLAELRQGRVPMGEGVEFMIGPKCVVLKGRHAPNRPEQVGFSVGAKIIAWASLTSAFFRTTYSFSATPAFLLMRPSILIISRISSSLSAGQQTATVSLLALRRT
jgi:hypothetical protein